MEYRNAFLAIPALTILAAALTASPVLADSETEPAPEKPTIRVVNNHQAQVAVYVVDSEAERHYVGAVDRTRFEEFELPSEWTDGTFRVQILPRSNPAGLSAWSTASPGIETYPVEIGDGQAIQLFVEPELERTIAEIAAAE